MEEFRASARDELQAMYPELAADSGGLPAGFEVLTTMTRNPLVARIDFPLAYVPDLGAEFGQHRGRCLDRGPS